MDTRKTDYMDGWHYVVDAFTTAFLECALWSTNDESDETGGRPLDDTYTIEDFDLDTIIRLTAECAQFQTENWDMISGDLEQAGHDFWLTRNGRGAGFWDGDWPEHGDNLTEASKRFGEINLYVGDDGKIYG